MLPSHDNLIDIDENRTDKWGLPVLKIDCEIGENENMMRVDMMNDMAESLDAAGVVVTSRPTIVVMRQAWESTKWEQRAWVVIRKPRS